AAERERFDGAGHRLERLGVQRAEALVDEQAVERHRGGGALHLLAELERERQRGEERLATGERVCASLLAGVVVVDDVEAVLAVLEGIAPAEVHQAGRSTLRELAETLV